MLFCDGNLELSYVIISLLRSKQVSFKRKSGNGDIFTCVLTLHRQMEFCWFDLTAGRQLPNVEIRGKLTIHTFS